METSSSQAWDFSPKLENAHLGTEASAWGISAPDHDWGRGVFLAVAGICGSEFQNSSPQLGGGPWLVWSLAPALSCYGDPFLLPYPKAEAPSPVCSWRLGTLDPGKLPATQGASRLSEMLIPCRNVTAPKKE